MITILLDLEEIPDFQKYYFKAIKDYIEKELEEKVFFYSVLPNSKKFENFEKKFDELKETLEKSDLVIAFGSASKIFYPYEDIFREFGIYQINKLEKTYYLSVFPPIVYFIDKDASWGFHHLVWFLRKIKYKNLKENVEKRLKIEVPLKKKVCKIFNLGINNIDEDVEKFIILNEDNKHLLEQFKEEILKSEIISFDTEFYDISSIEDEEKRILWYNSKIQVFLVSFVFEKDKKIYCYLIYYPLFKSFVQEIIKTLLENSKILIGLNIRLDLFLVFRDIFNFDKEKFINWIKNYFENLNIIDLRHFLLIEDNSKTKGVSLKSLSSFYLQTLRYDYLIDLEKNYGIELLKHFTKKEFSISSIMKEFNNLFQYSMFDSIVSYKLYKIFEKNIKNRELLELYKKQSRLSFFIEYLGINLNLKELSLREEFINKYVQDIQTFFSQYLGIKNINSNKQLEESFKKIANKKTMNFLNKTPTGQYSFKYQDLEIILKNYYDSLNNDEKIFFEYLYKYKIINHLKETFYNYKKFIKFIDETNNYIHPEFSEFTINSGRITTKHPCIAQIPGEKNIVSSVGKSEFEEYKKVGNVREIFLPDNNEHFLVEVDLSQADVRLAYLLSQDPQLYEDLHSDDLYISLYSTLFGKDKAQVSKAERQFIKVIILGMLYGLKTKGILNQIKELGEQIDLKSMFPDKEIFSINFAKEINNLFYEKYNVYINNYLNKINNLILQKKELDIIRKRVFNAIYFIKDNEILNKVLKTKYDIINTAYNFPIQGFTNDIIFIMAYYVQKEMFKNDVDGRVINLIYDAFLVSLNKKDWNKFIQILEGLLNIIEREKDYFSFVARKISKFLNRDIIVFPFLGFEIKIGKNWGNMIKEIKIKNKKDFEELCKIDLINEVFS